MRDSSLLPDQPDRDEPRTGRARRVVLLVAIATVAAALPILVGAQPTPRQPAATPPATPPAQRNASAGATAGACVPAEVGTRLAACPSNAPAQTKGGTAPRSQLQQIKAKTVEKKQGPRGPSIELSAAQRSNRERVAVRASALLEREVSTLQRIIRNMRREDPRRPDYLLRLAETYFEMQQTANAAVPAVDEPLFQARQSKNAQRVQALLRQQQAGQRSLDQARTNAITTYATLVQDHPNFRRMDEVLFSLGFALEEMRQFDRARQVYHRLIKGFPQSRFIPNAYLSFAEYFFTEGDMRAALQFYQKVTEIPQERNPVYGFALYKQSWCYYNLEDFRGALNQFVQTIEFANQNPDARDAANLARQSRRELVLPYSQVGNPARALEFFGRFSTSPAQALEMFEALGELYFDTGQWANTISVYQKLMAEQPTSDKICYWQSRVTNAIISSRPKPEQVREVTRLVDLYEAYAGQQHAAESQAQCKSVTASVIVELSTAWHREAIGTDTQPGTNDRNTMLQASQLYRLVLQKFPDMERMQFPDIDRRDWPTQYRVSYFYAELLWKMENWAECGPAFDRVVELNPGGEFTADAAYAAVLCYNNVYQQQYQGRERQSRNTTAPNAGRRRPAAGRRGQPEPAADPGAEYRSRDLTATENGMLNAFQRYICFVNDAEELPQIKYRRARIYYESNHYEEAALIFKDIAMNHRDSELAEYAANLYLDSVNILGTYSNPPRTACFQEIEDGIDPLAQIYCRDDATRASHAELCTVLDRLRCGIMRKKAEALHGNRDFRGSARVYVQIFQRYRANPELCGDEAHPGGRMDEVLWNAAIEYEAARLLGRAIRVRKRLIELFATSELSKRALYLVGANYHALAIYGQAAEYYEQFARRYPGEDGTHCSDEDRRNGTCTNAIEALQNATFFRLGLGEEDAAIANGRLFEQNYRTRRARETSSVIFSLGSIYERQQNWTKAIGHYRGYLSSYGRTALPHQVIRANVQIAHAYWTQNDRSHAEPFFRAAIGAWEHGAPAAIAALPDTTDDQKREYLNEAKKATAEALFYTAEYLFENYRRIAFPPFRGGHALADVTRWAQGPFREWLTSKTAALRTAEEAYNRVRSTFCPADQQACLEVPQWQIASAARAGEMYRVFVDAFEDAPVPEEIENDDELYQIYVGALNEQRQIFYDQAIPRFEFCLRTATAVRWFSEFSQQCERELNGLNPSEYPMAAELRGEATYSQRVSARPGPVELQATGAADEDAAGGGAD